MYWILFDTPVEFPTRLDSRELYEEFFATLMKILNHQNEECSRALRGSHVEIVSARPISTWYYSIVAICVARLAGVAKQLKKSHWCCNSKKN